MHLIDLKGVHPFEDCHCWKNLGVHLGRNRADMDFNEVLGCNPCGLYQQGKVKVRHDLMGYAVQQSGVPEAATKPK